jgi:hypothetical protein
MYWLASGSDGSSDAGCFNIVVKAANKKLAKELVKAYLSDFRPDLDNKDITYQEQRAYCGIIFSDVQGNSYT